MCVIIQIYIHIYQCGHFFLYIYLWNFARTSTSQLFCSAFAFQKSMCSCPRSQCVFSIWAVTREPKMSCLPSLWSLKRIAPKFWWPTNEWNAPVLYVGWHDLEIYLSKRKLVGFTPTCGCKPTYKLEWASIWKQNRHPKNLNRKKGKKCKVNVL